jgi:hypothetical protein
MSRAGGVDPTAVRPFRVNVPEADPIDLRRRIASTRWPQRETVADDSQGVPLATTQKLMRVWGGDYDWSACETRLNALPQFLTEIDGLDIHFIHVRSKHANAMPLIVTHGWPGSVIEQLKIIDPLEPYRPRCHRLRRVPPRDSIVARLRIFRQAGRDGLGSGPHRASLGRPDEAPRVCEVRRSGR